VGYIVLFSRCLTGVVFAVSAVTKLRSPRAFAEFATWVAELPALPARARRPASVLMAGAEAAAVLLLALPWTAPSGLALATATLAVFAAGTLLVTRAGVRVPCQCFGTSRAPIGMRHVVRNTGLCAVAAAGTAVAIIPPGSTSLAGAVLALGAAFVTALFVVFLDDLAAFLSEHTALEREPGR